MKSRNSKFEFYERVKILSAHPNLEEVSGEISAVLGKAENEEGKFSYAVFVYRDEKCWSVREEDLESTGEFDKRETFFSGEKIKIRVDEKGRGSISSDQEEQNQ